MISTGRGASSAAGARPPIRSQRSSSATTKRSIGSAAPASPSKNWPASVSANRPIPHGFRGALAPLGFRQLQRETAMGGVTVRGVVVTTVSLIIALYLYEKIKGSLP